MARIRILQQSANFYLKRQLPLAIRSLKTTPAILNCQQRLLSTSSWRLKYEYPEIPEDEKDLIVRSPYSDVEIPEVNLADFVWKDVDKWPERTALICGMTGREYTYEMAHSMSKKFGSALLRMGAKKGDVLCMVVPNIPEFPIAFFGAAGVGVTLTTMNPTYRPGK